ncbi:hypothetical protein [Spirosoma sp. 209]|uniref:hypothetical protein n=1 Tax=Spirosoma sp. 209 TaxID=1955701 RepID=UPI00098D51DC|nr:hypothetical protein [Spirosoma sp. 209]
MAAATGNAGWQEVNYRIVGFDRPCFVSDVLQAVPQTEACQLVSVHFEADGIRAIGELALRLPMACSTGRIDQQLQSVKGIVRIDTVL